MMKGILIILVAALSSVFVAGCGSKPAIPIEKMKLVMWDLAMADEFSGYYIRLDSVRNLDSATNTLYYRVLAMHEVSRQEFNEAIKFYQEHPKVYRELLDSITTYSNRLREESYNKRYRRNPIELDRDTIH